MKEELEIIRHSNPKYHSFIVNLLYRTPHVHNDFEVCILLDGTIGVYVEGKQTVCHAGDIWVMNPYQRHELRGDKPSVLGVVQVPLNFLIPFSSGLRQIFFSLDPVQKNDTSYEEIKDTLLLLIGMNLETEPQNELKTAEYLLRLFRLLIEVLPHQYISDKQRSVEKANTMRMRRISEYIDENYSQKLLLGEIAERENLTMGYISHFFREAFGMPFQTYLNRYRCEKARELLLTTDLPILDISVTCGFSDVKYLNKYFRTLYGASPKNYVEQFRKDSLPAQQQSMLSTQSILSRETSRILLDRYLQILNSRTNVTL